MQDLPFANSKRFWLITIIALLAYAGLFILTNRINNLDELHYLSLAFEMHKQHFYLLPMTLGHPDIQKPPLLYWLINLGWSLFGMSTTWPLMLITLINLGCLYFTFKIAQKLFSTQPIVAFLSVVILATGVFWFHFFERIRFDGLLTLCTLAYLHCVLNAAKSNTFNWSILAGLCLGLGFLAKGAAILVFGLPFYGLLPRYYQVNKNFRQWLGYFGLSFVISLLIVAAWAIPLYLSLGEKLIDTMFIKQQHSRILWTHHLSELPTVWLSFLPWSVLPVMLLNFKKLPGKAKSPLMLLVWSILLPSLFFTFFVLMHVKRYLLPLYPFVAIVLAYIFSISLERTKLHLQNKLLSLITLIVGLALCSIPLLPTILTQKILPQSNQYAIWGLVLILTAAATYITSRSAHIKNQLYCLIATISALLIVGICGINGIFTKSNDVFLQRLAEQMQHLQYQGVPQANLISGGYQAFAFKGQLQQPLPLLNENSFEFHRWINHYPTGILYFSARKHIRPCLASHAFHLKGSDRIISWISVQQYQLNC